MVIYACYPSIWEAEPQVGTSMGWIVISRLVDSTEWKPVWWNKSSTCSIVTNVLGEIQ